MRLYIRRAASRIEGGSEAARPPWPRRYVHYCIVFIDDVQSQKVNTDPCALASGEILHTRLVNGEVRAAGMIATTFKT